MKPDINYNGAHTFEHNPCCLVPGIVLCLHYNDTSLCIALEELYGMYQHREVICDFCLYFTAIFCCVFSCAMIQSLVHFYRY